MRSAATGSLRIKLLMLLLCLVLFVLCKPAEGASAARTANARQADGVSAKTSAKAKTTATVKAKKKTKRRAKASGRHQTRSRRTKARAAAKTKVAATKAKPAAAVKAKADAAKARAALPAQSVNATLRATADNATVPAAAVRAGIAASAGNAGNATAQPSLAGPPAAPKRGDRWIEPRTGMAFRYIPAGCFTMGSPRTEPGRERDEGPLHKVCLSGFWIGETEVTQGQWTAIMGENPSLVKNGEEQPVDMVSWGMAKKFAKALGQRGGEAFRLPTEAEWEYACRAGTTTAYFYGDAISHDQASYDKPFSLPAQPLVPRHTSRKRRHVVHRHAPRVWPNMHTSVVGTFPPNAYGLFDMHGNLWEWCEDVYDAGYYAHSPHDNPLRLGEGKSRVMRGGSWVTRAESLRSANRGHGWPAMRTAFYGLRLVRMERTAPRAAQPAPEISR